MLIREHDPIKVILKLLHKAHSIVCNTIVTLGETNPNIPELLLLIDNINKVKLRMTKDLENAC